MGNDGDITGVKTISSPGSLSGLTDIANTWPPLGFHSLSSPLMLSFEMLCIISCNSSTVNNLFLSLRINAIILSCKQEIINRNSRISHVRRATNHRPDPPIRGSANYGNPRLELQLNFAAALWDSQLHVAPRNADKASMSAVIRVNFWPHKYPNQQ